MRFLASKEDIHKNGDQGNSRKNWKLRVTADEHRLLLMKLWL